MSDKEKFKGDTNWDWVDEDLNPILPEEYLERTNGDEHNIMRYEILYNSLVSGKKLDDDTIDNLLTHFRAKGDVIKMFKISKIKKDRENLFCDKINKILNEKSSEKSS